MIVELHVGPIWTALRLVGGKPDQVSAVIAIVRANTSAYPEGYRFMPAYRAGTWDGLIRLFKDGKFPTGLLERIKVALHGYEIQVNTMPPFIGYEESVIKPDMFDGITMRPYQMAAARTLLKAQRGIAKMATNSGKTEVIAAICAAVSNQKILVLTTKRDLLYQTSRRIEGRLLESVGVVGDAHEQRERVTVAMVQTLCRKDLKAYRDIGVVMYDEVHHLPAKTSQAVFEGLYAPMRFGFSGTPLSGNALNDLMLIGATGEVLVDIGNLELIEAGVSTAPIIHLMTINGDKKHYKDDWDTNVYSTLLVQNSARNTKIIELAKRVTGVTLILVERLEHGNALLEAIPGAVFVHGSSSMEERLLVVQHASGVIIATPIFDEGVDVPTISNLILAGGGRAQIKLMQRLGRGMRRAEGKTNLHVYDFVDEQSKYLLEHSLARVKLYEAEGFQVLLDE